MGGIYFIKEHSQFRVENIVSVELSCSKKISLALLEKLKVHETFLLQKNTKNPYFLNYLMKNWYLTLFHQYT